MTIRLKTIGLLALGLLLAGFRRFGLALLDDLGLGGRLALHGRGLGRGRRDLLGPRHHHVRHHQAGIGQAVAATGSGLARAARRPDTTRSSTTSSKAWMPGVRGAAASQSTAARAPTA